MAWGANSGQVLLSSRCPAPVPLTPSPTISGSSSGDTDSGSGSENGSGIDSDGSGQAMAPTRDGPPPLWKRGFAGNRITGARNADVGLLVDTKEMTLRVRVDEEWVSTALDLSTFLDACATEGNVSGGGGWQFAATLYRGEAGDFALHSWETALPKDLHAALNADDEKEPHQPQPSRGTAQLGVTLGSGGEEN